MIAHALRARSGLTPGQLHVADLRDVRLGRAFDVVTCLGLTCSYLLQDGDLHAGCATFAAHARRGTLIVLNTLVEEIPDTRPATGNVELSSGFARVTVWYEWEAGSRTSTLHRLWSLPDGSRARHAGPVGRALPSGRDTRRPGAFPVALRVLAFRAAVGPGRG